MNDLGHQALVAEVISHIAKQKTKQLGLDGKGYTQDEFLTEYGEVRLRFWQEAPHFINTLYENSNDKALLEKYPKKRLDHQKLALFIAVHNHGA